MGLIGRDVDDIKKYTHTISSAANFLWDVRENLLRSNGVASPQSKNVKIAANILKMTSFLEESKFWKKVYESDSLINRLAPDVILNQNFCDFFITGQSFNMNWAKENLYGQSLEKNELKKNIKKQVITQTTRVTQKKLSI